MAWLQALSDEVLDMFQCMYVYVHDYSGGRIYSPIAEVSRVASWRKLNREKYLAQRKRRYLANKEAILEEYKQNKTSINQHRRQLYALKKGLPNGEKTPSSTG